MHVKGFAAPETMAAIAKKLKASPEDIKLGDAASDVPLLRGLIQTVPDPLLCDAVAL
jgi:hypothetical protein